MVLTTPIDVSGPRVSIPTPLAVREAAKAALDAGATHYTDRPGVAGLREAVAIKLAEANRVAVAPADEVLITCGVQEALYLALQVLAGVGDEVIVTGPALPDDVELVRMVGAAARIAPVGDQLELDVDRVRELITRATKVMVLRSPSLSGEVLTGGVLEQLGALVVERDLRVVAIQGDDALIASGVEQPSIGAVAGLGPRTVTIGGFAAVGLEAWRVGYLAAQREMMGDIRRLKQELSICSPAVSQYAALDAIPHLAGYAAALREQLDVRRIAVARALEHADFEHVVPQAGIFVFVKPPSGMPVRTAIASAAEAGVLVADGGCVGADGWLRLTLDHDRQILDEAVRELGNAISNSPAERPR